MTCVRVGVDGPDRDRQHWSANPNHLYDFLSVFPFVLFSSLLRHKIGRNERDMHMQWHVLCIPVKPSANSTTTGSQALEDYVQHEDDQVKIVATHPPLGVVGAICPWNFPVILSTLKIASSLITGNCVIVKPSPFTPYAVLKLVELCIPLFPPGVFQAVNGGAELGAMMTVHPGIQKISFTGTIATGKKIMAACAATLKKLTLELAGNDAAIVLPDVNVDEAVGKTANGSFFNAGQMCVATKRIYVHEDIYDEFLPKFIAEVKQKYRISTDGEIPTVFGPVSNELQFKTVNKMLEDAKARGVQMESFEEKVPEKGYWVPATVIVNPPEDALVVKEEQFGMLPNPS